MRYPEILSQLKLLGHASFRLDGPTVIYIDPWKLGADAPPADLILITHDHYDHFSLEDIRRISRDDTIIVANPAAAAKLSGATQILRPGESISLAGATIRAAPAYNLNKFKSPGQLFHPMSDEGVGYIIERDDETLYHIGDSDTIPEMAGLKVTVALMPISGVYVMTADEAFEAAQMIQADFYVPMHYGDIAGDQSDVEKFRYLCEQQGLRVVVLPKEADVA